jgi:hypothetical protein
VAFAEVKPGHGVGEGAEVEPGHGVGDEDKLREVRKWPWRESSVFLLAWLLCSWTRAEVSE